MCWLRLRPPVTYWCQLLGIGGLNYLGYRWADILCALHRAGVASMVCGISLVSGTHIAMQPSKDPLHCVTLEALLNALVAKYGWAELAKRININCFKSDPSIKSSLKFLRRTPWARKEVEELYIDSLDEPASEHTAPPADNPWANWQSKK